MSMVGGQDWAQDDISKTREYTTPGDPENPNRCRDEALSRIGVAMAKLEAKAAILDEYVAQLQEKHAFPMTRHTIRSYLTQDETDALIWYACRLMLGDYVMGVAPSDHNDSSLIERKLSESCKAWIVARRQDEEAEDAKMVADRNNPETMEARVGPHSKPPVCGYCRQPFGSAGGGYYPSCDCFCINADGSLTLKDQGLRVSDTLTLATGTGIAPATANRREWWIVKTPVGTAAHDLAYEAHVRGGIHVIEAPSEEEIEEAVQEAYKSRRQTYSLSLHDAVRAAIRKLLGGE